MAEDFQSQNSHDPAMDTLAEAIFNRNRGEETTENAAEEGADVTPEVETTADPEELEATGEDIEVTQEPEEVFEGDDTVYEVVVNGETIDVPLSELVSGYSRQKDYTRKTMELAEQRREMETQSQGVTMEQREAAQRMSQVTAALEAELTNYRDDPNELNALRIQNPGEYAARMADQQRRHQLLEMARQEQASLEQKQLSEEIIPRAVAELKQREAAFASNFDSTYEEVGRWVTHPSGGGLSVDEWNQVTDPRQVLIAFKAMQADKQGKSIQAATPRIRKKVASLPKVRSGAPRDPGESETAAYQDSLKALQTDSSLDAIANAFRRRAELKRTR